MERVQEVRGVVRAADVDSDSPSLILFFKEVGHFCELGGSRESRKPFRRKAGAKRFTSRPGALRAPRGRPDLKNDRLLNLLACDKLLRKPCCESRSKCAACARCDAKCSALVPGPHSGGRSRLRLQLSSPSGHFLDHFLDDLADLSP